MDFSGQIEDFPVMDFMQYLHTGKKSGTLCLENGTKKGRVLFKGGQIIRAGKPGMTNLGDLLLERKAISQNDLKAAIRIQEAQSSTRPLGMILEEMGLVTHRAVRDAVVRQIEEVVYDLVTWEEGAFNFKLENYEPWDDIAVAPHDVIPPEESDTKLLLMEAMRIFETTRDNESEQEEPAEIWEDKNFVGIPESELGEKIFESNPTSGNGFENLEQSLSLLKKMLVAGRENRRSQSVSVSFLRLLSEHLDRAILFLVRKGELLGLGAFGKTIDLKSLDREIRNLRLPLERDSLLANCIKSRSPFQGEPEVQPWLEVLHQRIGSPQTSEIMVLPVAGVERVICMVYGDNGAAARPINHLELLEIAAGQAGIIFENTTLRKQVQRKNH